MASIGYELVLYTLTNGFNILDLGANYQGLIEGTVLIAAAAIYTIGGRRSAPKKTATIIRGPPEAICHKTRS
jgi:ribose/xylose/arabinose/galactoside ABC-type transport system permease subunit